jgi:hypothetical protein
MDPISLAVAGASILSNLWGGKKDRQAARKQQELALRQREQSLNFIQDQVAKTQGQLFTLFPQAQESRFQGQQAALNALGGSFMPMMDTYRQGNMMAQQALLQGLPMANNALLGNPIDYSQLQAQQIPLSVQALGGLTNPQALNFAPISQG